MSQQGGTTLCPYDPAHVVSNQRAIPHFTKCRQQHPHLHKIIGICPYNQGHHVPLNSMKDHLKSCRDFQVSVSGRSEVVNNQGMTGASSSVEERNNRESSTMERFKRELQNTDQEELDEWT